MKTPFATALGDCDRLLDTLAECEKLELPPRERSATVSVRTSAQLVRGCLSILAKSDAQRQKIER